MSEKTRIIDIAQELGLSTATVSNVINGKTKKISDETVKRVQELLEKKNYLPNRAEILLGQNSSRIVGVVVNDHEKYEKHVLEDAFISASLNALSAEIDRADYFMMVKVTADWNEIVRIASMWNMEGLVLIGFCEQDCRKLRENMHIPFVVYDGYFDETQRICNLTIDNFDGGRQVGEYLRRMGHRRVLCIADNFICMDKERMDGCWAGMMGRKAGGMLADPERAGGMSMLADPKRAGCMDMLPDSEYAGNVKRLPESGHADCMEKLPGRSGRRVDFLQIPMRQEERSRFYKEKMTEILEYTAVFAVSDFYAVDLIRALQEQGVRVPEDISVVGFDGCRWCEKAYPGLTTVEQDSEQRARLAISVLRELKNGNYEKTTIKLPVHLVQRSSVKQLADM